LGALTPLGTVHAPLYGEPAPIRMEHYRVHDLAVEAGVFIIQHSASNGVRFKGLFFCVILGIYSNKLGGC